MKKTYITPIVCDFINVETQSFLSGSPNGNNLTGGSSNSGDNFNNTGEVNTDDDDYWGARQRGGDYGSLW